MQLCGCCRCPQICGCNTSCCCFFKIPLGLGYVFSALWFLFNGLTFPATSILFWPRHYIFYGTCAVFGLNAIFVLIAFVNMHLKRHKLFNLVLYGIFSSYIAGGLIITVGVNAERDVSSDLLVESFQKKFDVTIPPSTTLRMLQGIQIMYYTYLLSSYVYCGFVLQLYEIKHDKRYTKAARRPSE